MLVQFVPVDERPRPMLGTVDGEDGGGRMRDLKPSHGEGEARQPVSRLDLSAKRVHRLLALQRSAGNAATAQLVRLAEVQREDESFAPIETIPSMGPDQQPGVGKGVGELKEDSGAVRLERARAVDRGPAPSRDPAAGTRVPLKVGAMTLEATMPEDLERAEAGAQANDAVAATIGGVSFTNPGGKPTTAFGSESFNPGFTNATISDKGELNFTLAVACPWGTNAGGKVDVSSATDPVVTADSAAKIASDLTPVSKLKSWVAPRTQYWSQAICERHERFHSTDDKSWSEGPGKQVVLDYLNGQEIDISNKVPEALAHLNDAMKSMRTANMQFYKGGAAEYYAYAGEERAFGDGKAPYETLAAGVKSQGESLATAKAAAERTENASTPPTREAAPTTGGRGRSGGFSEGSLGGLGNVGGNLGTVSGALDVGGEAAAIEPPATGPITLEDEKEKGGFFAKIKKLFSRRK